MLMQKFGGANKEYYGMFESGLLDNLVGFDFCYLTLISAVSLATFVAFLMVFLLETALQEGIPLHKLEHSLVSGYFWGRNMCVWMGSWGKNKNKSCG